MYRHNAELLQCINAVFSHTPESAALLVDDGRLVGDMPIGLLPTVTIKNGAVEL